MTYIVAAYAGDTFRGVVDNTQVSAETAEAAALKWLTDVADKSFTATVAQDGDVQSTFGWDEVVKAWGKLA